MDSSEAERYVTLEVRLSSIVSPWSLFSGQTFVAPFSFQFDGMSHDVVNVITEGYPKLTRAESLAECLSTSFTFFYDPDVPDTGERWDDGVTQFDQGVVRWDQFPKIYVNYGGMIQPPDVTISAEIAFYYDGKGETHPILGDDKMSGIGSFEEVA